MARLGMSGFETGNIAAEPQFLSGFSGSGMSIEATIVRTGAGSLKAQAASGVSGFLSLGAQTGSYRRVYLRVTARPSTTARIIVGSAASYNVKLNPNGTLSFYDSASLVGTSTAALTDTSRWYMVEFTGLRIAGAAHLRIDGVDEVVSGSSNPTLTGGGSLGPNDTVADTYTAYFDDYAEDSAAFPGAGAVVLLKPASDASIGTGWTQNSGGTSNLFSSVDNTPPIGTTDNAASTNGNQIRNGANVGSPSTYTANLQTYSAAGVGAGDTVNAVIAFCIHGEGASTGTKTGTFTQASNPSASGQTFTYGNDAGACGTWPSTWTLQVNPIVTSPSVTVGNAPQLSVSKDTTGTTRPVDVCFMGLYVDYTPAAGGAALPFFMQGPLLTGGFDAKN